MICIKGEWIIAGNTGPQQIEQARNNITGREFESLHWKKPVFTGILLRRRNWACYDKIIETLKDLEDDETLLVQSGKPVGVFKTHTVKD